MIWSEAAPSHYLHNCHRRKSHGSLLPNRLPNGAAAECYLSEYARGTASNSVTNRRAKALCRHGGNPTLPCGKIYLEHLNAPEVTKCGFEQPLHGYLHMNHPPEDLLTFLRFLLHITNRFWMIVLHSYAVGVECSTSTLPIFQLVSIFPYHQCFFSFKCKERHGTSCIDHKAGVFSTMGITVPAYPTWENIPKYLKPTLSTLCLILQSLFKAQPVIRLISFMHAAYPLGRGNSSEIEVLAIAILFWNILALESDKIH